MYQLYYSPRNASAAVHWLLHDLNVPYELIRVDRKQQQQKSAEYLKLNPSGRIPTLLIDGQPLSETAAILITLCERHPEQAKIPALVSPDRSKFWQWMMYLTNTLQNELMVYFYPHTTDSNGIEAIKQAQVVRLAEILTLIDRELSHHTYLVGDTLTACDFFLFLLGYWCLALPQPLTEYPNLTRFMRLMAKHPSITAVNDIEQFDLDCDIFTFID